ncbi:phage baseplate assembly protein V [Escherichia coli]|nr:phage baseplate assembly protein V [Escherichia coli]
MNAQLTEIMRLITNLIRTGVVTEVDRENWLCRVKTGDLETNWINWLTLRAGNARTWWKPSEGEQVVLLSLGGNLETAFALPAVYSNQFAPPSTSADACVTEHPDGGWFEYEPATGRWYVRGIKSMVIEAADNITMKTREFVLEADRTRINSEVVINGGVTAAVTRTSSALSWLAGAPLALLRRGLASSGHAADLLTAPLSSLRHSASLTGNVLKTVAGAPVALLRSGLSGLRAVAVMFVNPLAVLRGGLTAAGTVLRVLASGPLAMLRVALYAVSGLLGALLSPIGLVVTALAGVALVVWKYWQPITAFLGGVVEGFKAAAGPISAAFEPLKPVFQWIGDKVQALWGWFTDLLTPVKSTSAELQSAAAMGRRFGEALAEGLNMVMHPLDSLKSGVSWLLEKLGIVSKEAAKAKLPERVTRQQPATVNADGKVMMPSGGFPSWGYGFAGMYDSGGYIPRGQFGIVGENGPEIVNGPANVTSRRNTAVLAAVVAGMMGVAAAPAELPPLHPLALPAKGGEAMVSRAATVPPVQRLEAPTQIIIQTQPGQSAQDIAREVARQLDERERRLKAKARSNYSDQGGYDA